MVLITGASKGIGEALAIVCAQQGHDLLLIARSTTLLKEQAQSIQKQYNVKVHPLSVDLCKAEAIQIIEEYVHKHTLEIDILINNAGMGACGDFVSIEAEQHQKQVLLNISALTLLTHSCLQGMSKRKRGKILNIASTAAFQPGPYMAVYFATKAYVLSFSQALRHELRGTGITVTTHCPGPTESAFAAQAGNDKTMLFKQGKVATSQEVAEHAYHVMMRGTGVAVHGWMNRFGALLAPHVPYWLTNRLATYLNTPR